MHGENGMGIEDDGQGAEDKGGPWSSTEEGEGVGGRRIGEMDVGIEDVGDLGRSLSLILAMQSLDYRLSERRRLVL